MKTVWRKHAKETLRLIIQYIRIDSDYAADKVKETILDQIDSLALFPNKFAIEPHVSSDERIYRFITIWSYKIIYRVSESEIRVVDIFHAKRNPDRMRGEE